MRQNPVNCQAETWHLACAGGKILRLASLAQDDSAQGRTAHDSLRHGACGERAMPPPSKREAFRLPLCGRLCRDIFRCAGTSSGRCAATFPVRGEGDDTSSVTALAGDAPCHRSTLRCPENTSGLR